MKRPLAVFLALAIGTCPFFAAGEGPAVEATAPPAAEAPAKQHLPGIALAEGISQITGVAISPLLGVSAVGVWTYYRTPSQYRGELPWHCHPAAWGVGLGLLAICFLKDLLGTATPTILKKPLDLLELFEDKLSAIVASAAFVPLIVSQMADAFSKSPPAGGASLGLAEAQYASALPAALAFLDPRLFLLPFALFSFVVVWITSHAINVLIVMSPFGIVDAGLKLIRTGVLSSLALACVINPFLGAAISLLIICIAAWLAPAALRFAIFGTLTAADILLPGRSRRRATPERPHVFTARKFAELPIRTFGRLTLGENGCLSFAYRPWLILPRRSIPLPAEPVTIARGILFPSLLQAMAPSSRFVETFAFLPRYRGREEELAKTVGAVSVQEHAFEKGFAAVRSWFAEIVGRVRTPAPNRLPAAG